MTALMNIIKKKQEFFWNDKVQEAFKELKWLFAEEFILQMFNLRKQIIMKVNALNQV